MSSDHREVGLTADAGFEIGVSATVDHPLDEVFAFLISESGSAIWLGAGSRLGSERGDPYETTSGTRGEVRSIRPGDRMRVTYQPRGRSAPTTVQVVVRPASDPSRTSVRFHQERLDDSGERSAQREHWKAVLDQLTASLGAY